MVPRIFAFSFAVIVFALGACSEERCDVCSDPTDLVGEWRGGTITRVEDSVWTLDADGGWTFETTNQVSAGTWSADERSLTLVQPLAECDESRTTLDYYVAADAFYTDVLVPIESNEGLVGTWERVWRQTTSGCIGQDEVYDWNATMDLAADGTGSIDEDLPAGRERFNVRWEVDGDMLLLEYMLESPTAESERAFYIGDGVVLAGRRYLRAL